jgi:site-specific recombinase XerD
MTPVAVKWILRRAMKAAKLTAYVTPHSFRHNFASKLLRSGADLKSVQDLLGHRSIQSTQVYLHSHPALLRGAVGRLDF